jgi:hypothetical protein
VAAFEDGDNEKWKNVSLRREKVKMLVRDAKEGRVKKLCDCRLNLVKDGKSGDG